MTGPVRHLDCLGKPCPIPVIELAKALADAAPGDVVSVLSDDPAARLDVPAFCRMRGHALLSDTPAAVGRTFAVRRGQT